MLALMPMVLGMTVYLTGAMDSVMLDERLASRQEMLGNSVLDLPVDLQAEQVLADAYWTRNPDVAADEYFGRNGKLGIHGARKHYQRHGRYEGRVWGL